MATTIKNRSSVPDAMKLSNAIRNESGIEFQRAVPYATSNNSREFGSAVLSDPDFTNQYLSALYNRIALVIITSRSKWENPWGFMNKGILNFGETVEEIYTNLIRGYSYDNESVEKLVFKRRIPDVKSVFHAQNVAVYYPATIETDKLKKAFLSWDGVNNMLRDIVDRMYTSWRYDEFNMMKYILARAILNNSIATVSGVSFDSEPEKAVISVKSVSNSMEIMSGNYTEIGVPNYTPKNKQYVILSTHTDAVVDVSVLAAAFNMSKTEFSGRKVLVDDFYTIDTERMTVLFSPEGTEPAITTKFVEFTDDEIAKLKTVQAVLMDENFMQIYYNLFKFTENYNGNGIYWNYFLHVWATFSHSPFTNACVFASGSGELTALSATIVSKSITPTVTILKLKIKTETSGIAGISTQFVEENSPVDIRSNGEIRIEYGNTNEFSVSVMAGSSKYTSSNTISSASNVGDEITFEL